MTNSPTLVEIRHAASKLQGQVLQTPVVPLTVNSFKKVLPANSAVMIKLELLQHAGSFKARGDWLGIDALSELQRASGVVAASGGNHALAVSWAAQAVGVSATILMPASADKVRIAGCKSNGATVLLFDDISTAFAEMERLAADENLAMMHPFEAPHMTLGAATCGAEYIDECRAPMYLLYLLEVVA